MDPKPLAYTGERLVPDDERLQQLLVEDLAKFHFACGYGEGKRVLDAGCGAAQGAAYLASCGAAYVAAVDISLAAVTYASSRFASGRLGFAALNVERLAFPDDSFDLVTSIEVIEHLYHPEEYVREIRRVLKSDGMLILSTPNKAVTSPRPGMMWPYHIHEFYPEELRELLARFFQRVDMFGLSIPVYESHPLRRLVRWLAPVAKPVLPHSLRTRTVPWLQRRIKSDLTVDDVVITPGQVSRVSSLVVVCYT